MCKAQPQAHPRNTGYRELLPAAKAHHRRSPPGWEEAAGLLQQRGPGGEGAEGQGRRAEVQSFGSGAPSPRAPRAPRTPSSGSQWLRRWLRCSCQAGTCGASRHPLLQGWDESARAASESEDGLFSFYLVPPVSVLEPSSCSLMSPWAVTPEIAPQKNAAWKMGCFMPSSPTSSATGEGPSSPKPNISGGAAFCIGNGKKYSRPCA